MLPPEVIATDNRLEQAESKASEALAKHRWHWTLDESNPKRESVNKYATAVSRSRSRVSSQVKGYAAWISGDAPSDYTLNDCIERAKMGEETAVVTEAIAEARGIGIAQVRKTRGNEVTRMRDWAREKAERKGTSVEEEIHSVVDFQIRSENADTQHAEAKKGARTFRFIELEGTLKKAQRHLVEALGQARAIDWGDEEVEMLADTVKQVKAVLGLIDMALVGTADVDWDGELASLIVKESE